MAGDTRALERYQVLANNERVPDFTLGSSEQQNSVLYLREQISVLGLNLSE